MRSGPLGPRVMWALPLMLIVAACGKDDPRFPPVMDPQTRGFCGTCHMAYQPSMLPALSWQVMMAELDTHFDEKVVLEPAAVVHITRYLTSHAGDRQLAGQAGRVALAGIRPNTAPQRLSATPYFKSEHSFLEKRVLQKWVGSVANCPACHVGAWVGDYRM